MKRARFISGGRIFKTGEILPETASARELAGRGFAEILTDPKPTKKQKAEPATAPANDTNSA
ncbi:MAG: hypothetical protein IJP89_02705 [Synergistaceae bacterium]|nr:hypothetical protein [Synergistaceae bacterium]